MTWRTDVENAPRSWITEETKEYKNGPKVIETTHWVYVILASKCGKVIKSKWLPETKRWEMFSKKEVPVAWQPWPSHPEEEV